MKEKLISDEDIRSLSPIFRGKCGDFCLFCAKRIFKPDLINKIYDDSKQFTGPQFCESVLKDVGLKVVTKNFEILDNFKNKPFITISNHPIGHLDGIALISEIGRRFPDYKMIVNFILKRIDTISENFITVNPYVYSSSHLKEISSSISGIKESLHHLSEGHPLGIFPAGAISRFRRIGTKISITDREWLGPIIRLIRIAKVPVIPIYINGHDSLFFYSLALINWRVRTARIAYELSNKRGKTLELIMGNPIFPEEQAQFKDNKSLGDFLRRSTYDLAKNK